MSSGVIKGAAARPCGKTGAQPGLARLGARRGQECRAFDLEDLEPQRADSEEGIGRVATGGWARPKSATSEDTCRSRPKRHRPAVAQGIYLLVGRAACGAEFLADQRTRPPFGNRPKPPDPF